MLDLMIGLCVLCIATHHSFRQKNLPSRASRLSQISDLGLIRRPMSVCSVLQKDFALLDASISAD